MNVSKGRGETERRLAAFSRAGVRRRLVVGGAVVGNADKGFGTGVIVDVLDIRETSCSYHNLTKKNRT